MTREYSPCGRRGLRASAMLAGILGLAALGCSTTETTTETTTGTTADTTAATTTETTVEPVDAEAMTRPVILASTSIWADVVGEITCGDLAEVSSIMPTGTDSHAYEPSLSDRAAMENADAIVMNGLDLESGLLATAEAVAESGVPVIAVADLVTTAPLEPSDEHDHDHGDEHDHDHGDEHDHSAGDPHLWFDPAAVATALDELAAILVADTGLDGTAVEACTAAYIAELLAVDAELETMFADIPIERRLLVTTHESLGHLARRFGFDIIGTALPSSSSLAETNPAALGELADAIRNSGVSVVFAEEELSPDALDAVAAQIGDISVVALTTESLGEPGSGADTYLGFLRTTGTTITEALR